MFRSHDLMWSECTLFDVHHQDFNPLMLHPDVFRVRSELLVWWTRRRVPLFKDPSLLPCVIARGHVITFPGDLVESSALKVGPRVPRFGIQFEAISTGYPYFNWSKHPNLLKSPKIAVERHSCIVQHHSKPPEVVPLWIVWLMVVQSPCIASPRHGAFGVLETQS